MANAAANLPTLKFNDGHSIPIVGFGTGTAMYKRVTDPAEALKIDEERVKRILTAINVGYRHIDCAESYNTEPELGVALKRCNIPRDQFFITTKCSHKSLHKVDEVFAQSLDKLGVDYVDLYLLHAPFVPDDVAKGKEEKEKVIVDAWKKAVEIQRKGKAKSIGVSNFSVGDLELLAKNSDVVPAVNQIEFHAYLPQPELDKYMREKGIAKQAYGSLVPIMTARPGPIDEILQKLAEKYKVTESEIGLRWCIDQGAVVITTSSKEQRMKDYLRVSDFKLTEEEVKEIATIGQQKRYREFWTSDFPPQK